MCVQGAVLPDPKSSEKNSNEIALRAWYGISAGLGQRYMRLGSCLRKLTWPGGTEIVCVWKSTACFPPADQRA